MFSEDYLDQNKGNISYQLNLRQQLSRISNFDIGSDLEIEIDFVKEEEVVFPEKFQSELGKIGTVSSIQKPFLIVLSNLTGYKYAFTSKELGKTEDNRKEDIDLFPDDKIEISNQDSSFHKSKGVVKRIESEKEYSIVAEVGYDRITDRFKPQSVVSLEEKEVEDHKDDELEAGKWVRIVNPNSDFYNQIGKVVLINDYRRKEAPIGVDIKENREVGDMLTYFTENEVQIINMENKNDQYHELSSKKDMKSIHDIELYENDEVVVKNKNEKYHDCVGQIKDFSIDGGDIKVHVDIDNLGTYKFSPQDLERIDNSKKVSSKRIRHVVVHGHHALYKDNELIAHWYGHLKDVQDIFDLISKNNLDLSKYGIVKEYAGKAILENYLEPLQAWPETYEELDNEREMGLYKGS